MMNDFFSKEKLSSKQQIFITGREGIILYSTMENKDAVHAGVLMSGLWQAANALSDFIPQKNKEDFFRLSFDTSSKGLYIYPFFIQKEEYYLGATYFDKLNPGQLKLKIQNLAWKLSKYLDKEMKEYKNIETKRDDFLFTDISDDEMDRLFSFVGH